MSKKSTRRETSRPTAGVLALLLSILLVTSAAAPAFAMDSPTPSDSSVGPVQAEEVPAESVSTPGTSDRGQSSEHPASVADAEVTAVSNATASRNGTGQSRSIPENATTTDVTLITGQTVTVVETERRTLYRADANGTMHRVSTPNGTYVFPESVDFDTFDRDLFNVDLLVRQNVTDGETGSIPVIVSQTQQDRYSTLGGESDSVDVLDSVAGTEKTQTLESIGAAAGQISKSDARQAYRALADSETVERVSLDVKYEVDLDDAPSIVSAEEARQKYGVTGNGVTVAVLDTGIDETHPDIDDAVTHQKDFTGEGRTDDLYGHGTHVAGIIAGDGSQSDGKYTGIAPDAELYNIRVLGEGGYGYTSDIIDGMEYSVDNGADVLSMSLGGTPDGLRSNDPYTDAVDYAYNNGVPVVVSAGNSGRDGYGTVGSPGVTKHAITVGATYKSGGITDFSSQGPTPYGVYLKPDLVAPGAGIVSARASGTSMGSPVDDYYTSASGTSMSAPVVTGTAALMLERNPSWSAEQVKSVLTTTADPLETGVNEYKQGAGMVNATDAVDSDVVVTPGTIDFGTYTSSTTASRVVTVENLGNSETTLNVSASATSISGDTGTVNVNRTTLTLSGGETAHLELTVDTSAAAGVYSGRLSFDEDQYTAIFGYARAHEVTVEKSGIAGTTTEHDVVWLFANESSTFGVSGYRGLTSIQDGKTTYRLLDGGEYNVVSHGVDESTGQSVVVSREVSITSNTRITLDESNTVEYQLNTDDLTRTHGPLYNKTVEVNYGKQTASNGWYGGGLITRSAESRTARFSADDRLNASVEHILVPEAATDAPDSYDASTIYHLIHATTGVSSAQTFDATRDQLAAKNVSYYRSEESQSYSTSLYAMNTKWRPMVGFAFAGELADRQAQTIYTTPNVGRYAQTVYRDSDWGLYSPTTVYETGERVDADANRHPYTGNVTGWDISGGSLNFTAVPQSSQTNGTWRFNDWESDDTVEVRLDGSTERVASDTWGSIDVGEDTPISVNSGTDVTVELRGDNPRMPLSTRTVSTLETTYDSGGDNTPPLLQRVNVSGMELDGTASVYPVTVRFTVQNQTNVDASNVSAWLAPSSVTSVPFEDSSGWSQASVTRVDDDTYEATLTPADPSRYFGRVNLALQITENNGDTAEVTTFDAFRGYDSAEPRVSVQSSPSERVSQHNPVAIAVERTDVSPSTTELLIEERSTGDVVHERDLSSAEQEAETTMTWNATDRSGTPVVSGEYDVVVRSSDANGNVNETATTIRVDHTKPTATITAVGATADPTSSEGPVHTNGTVGFEGTADGTPGAVDRMTFVLSADFANFRVPVSGTSSDGGTSWSAVGDVSDVPDDGNYTVKAVAVEPAGNQVEKTTDTTVVLDRDAPDLGATVEQVGNEGRVILRSDEELQTDSGNIDATVEKPTAGNDETVTLTPNETVGEYTWDGTFTLGDDGNYTVTASAADRAGNLGKTNSTAEIETVSVSENRTATVVLEKSGLFIEFRTNETGFDSTVTVTESRSALAPLSRNLAGVNFLNGQLGDELDANLDNATIGIPVEETNLPKNVDEGEVDISYYNQSNGKWELLDTRIEERTVNNETRTYWVTEVSHFSTYGAVADDQQPPQLDEASPDGESFASDTTQKTVTLNYSDDISGVDASAVELYFDGEEVTDDSATTVTGEYATYDATGLESGTYETKIVLEDEANNTESYTASFTVESESSGGGGGGGGGGGSVPPPSVRVEVLELTDSYAEAKITSARAGSPGDVSFDGGLTGGDVTFRGLSVTPKSSDAESRFFVEAESAASAPASVSAFEGAGETLGYLTVTPTYIGDADLDSVAVQFEVDDGIADSPKNVVLYRYDGSSWTAVPTESTGQQGGAYQFEASADATGTYAVGLDAPAFEVRDATLDATEVAPGEDVQVSATVENVGSGEGTYEVELVVDGETVATEAVTLASGEETTVEFTRSFEAGEHAVAVGSADAGTLVVSEGGERAMDDEQKQEKRDDNSGGIPGFGVSAALVALLTAALLARRAL